MQITSEEHLKKVQEIDVRDIDPSTLVDIKDVHIDTSLPVEQRLTSVLQQMNGNPYFFRSNGLVVRCAFKRREKTARNSRGYIRTSLDYGGKYIEST